MLKPGARALMGVAWEAAGWWAWRWVPPAQLQLALLPVLL